MSTAALFGVRVLDLDRSQLRVRFRVCVLAHESSGSSQTLPSDPSFFCRLLWEGAEERYGPLTDVVTPSEIRDQRWVNEHTHHFVASVERVAERRHEAGDTAGDRFAGAPGEWGPQGRRDEEELPRGDFDTWVTDVRWMESLRVGQRWKSSSVPGRAAEPWVDSGDRLAEHYAVLAGRGDMAAWFALGWLRHHAGDLEGAAEAYRRVADGPDRGLRGKALVYLGDVLAGQEEYEAAGAAYQRAEASEPHERYGCRYRSRAALRLGLLLRAYGRREAAREAFLRALALGEQDREHGLVTEVLHLMGEESPAAAAHRLLGSNERVEAARVLREGYGPAVAELAEPLFRDGAAGCEAVAASVDAGREDVDPETLAAFLVDLSLAWAEDPTRSDEAVETVRRLAVATGYAAEQYRRVCDSAAATTSRGREATDELLALLVGSGELDGALHRACARTVLWKARSELDDKEAALAAHTLAALLTEVGAADAARAVHQAVAGTADEEFQRLVEEAPVAAHDSDQRLHAACAYAHYLSEMGRQELAETLLRKVAEGKGQWAAAAAVTLGSRAHFAGDNATARQWWYRALAQGHEETSHQARRNLIIVAKDERDLASMLEHGKPTAESDHEEAPLFAAYLGELYYLLGQWQEALYWYEHSLARTDDDELVGEGGYRVGEILHGRGEWEAAVPYLRRARDSDFEPFARQAEELLASLV